MGHDIAIMWHHHPLLLVILAILCAALVMMLIKRLFQWVVILVLVIAVYSLFMYATGKKTKDQLWRQGKANAEKIFKSGKDAVQGDSLKEEKNPRRHSPRSE